MTIILTMLAIDIFFLAVGAFLKKCDSDAHEMIHTGNENVPVIKKP